MSQSFRSFFASSMDAALPIIFDGGLGTMIQAAQSADPSIVFSHPEELVFTRPDLIEGIHASYLAAGAQIITTNTFGANAVKLDSCSFCAADTVTAAVTLAKKAVAASGKEAFVAFDLGPTGKLLEPMGDLSFEAAVSAYKLALCAAEEAGADLAIIETISDLYEARAIILAVKESTDLPVFVTMTFQDSSERTPARTLTGADVLTCVTYLESLGPDALGFNCGGSLFDAEYLADSFVRSASIRVIAQPNAGIPVIQNGKTVFTVTPQEFAATQIKNLLSGVRILGGCCGTTPAHIGALVEAIAALNPAQLAAAQQAADRLREQNAAAVRICSYAQTASLDEPVIIGERINPTGKPKCKEALRQGNLQYLADEAALQIEAGAHILDVNTGLPGINEAETMLAAVRLLQKTFAVPLQIDSSDPSVLEQALRYYNGKALINSVNGKQESMDAVLPLVKRYGGLVVALALDETGIPQTAEGRLAVIERIVNEAAGYGIAKNRIVADALTLTVSSRQEDALETLRALSLIKNTLGIKTVLGVSNISFGLPRRDLLNAHFLNAALFAGLDACILNPLSQPMMDAFYTCRVLAARDKNCLGYLARYAGQTEPAAVVAAPKPQSGQLSDDGPKTGLYAIILNGYTARATDAARQALETQTPQHVIDSFIIPALDEAGKRYEKGSFFLPQLLLCADAASKVFDVLKQNLSQGGTQTKSKGRVLVATVYGDVHDIGKNIARAMLENYGYEVIDLGKNVAPELIVEKALEYGVGLVGLSALMTTTVVNMQKTITLLREAERRLGKKIAVMAGGAVLTESYAREIGADFYAKDALAAISAAKQIYGG